MTTLPHVEITLNARGLSGTQCDTYEALLKAVTQPPKERMITNMRRTTVGEEVSCEIQVNGRCELTDGLLAELRNLLMHVPEVNLTLDYGAPGETRQAKQFNERNGALWAEAVDIIRMGNYRLEWSPVQTRLRLVG